MDHNINTKTEEETITSTSIHQESKLLGSNKSSYKQILAIGGGKGGVGKTLVTANFAITLARAGAKVTLVDLDLGGANLHTCLGVEMSSRTLSDVFSSDIENIEDLCAPTIVPNLQLISGAHDSLNAANLPHAQKQKLIQRLQQLKSDYVILDLGAGTSFNTLDFFIAADVGILVVLPEPTSIENAYRFIKSAFYRKLKNIEHQLDARELVDKIVEKKEELGIKTPADLLSAIENESSDLGGKVRLAMNEMNLKLVVNQTRTGTDAEIGFGVKNVCKKYFGINVDYLGNLEYDSAVWQSVRRRKPLAVEFPTNPLVATMQKMVGHIVAEQAEKIKNEKSYE
ncbi:MAG: P-loop NTPase [Oligoflexia bacterium]|nr:P-loop NTPase [Oligoflexia bacterium]